MLFKTLPAVCALLAQAQAETILGVTVFTRHGDRTSKHYSGYSLTNLGAQQNFQVGGDYRNTYISSHSSKRILGISEDELVDSQLFATAPDQKVLLNTATAFLQGLYPPLDQLNPEISTETLNNGSKYSNPLNGYQYVVLHGKDAEGPDRIWLKGDEDCPAVTTSAKAFTKSEEFQTREKETRSFYQGFWDIMRNVYDYQQSNLTYKNAYDIFDLLNVASIHNRSSNGNITEQDLYQLRTLADSAKFASNYNQTDNARSIGAQTFAGAILTQLNQTITSKGALKFSLLAGSYDTFLAFFGLTNLTTVSTDFYGLPDYASTMSFELFTETNVTEFPANEDDLRVRFLFRNGSDEGAALRAFPLFGSGEEHLSWKEFGASMRRVAISSAEQWCGVCQSEVLFCNAYSNGNAAAAQKQGSSKDGMSNAVAGVIGAMVTLGVVATLGLAAFFLMRRRRATAAGQKPVHEKASQLSDDEKV